MCTIMKDALTGNVLKAKVLFDLRVRKSISLSDKQDDSLIISLTSYGYRARHCVKYTIYSLLKQRIRPGKIILWLGDKEFKDEPVPRDLAFLERFGFKIRYCEDIRSYTKLIPTLLLHGDKNIITVDDDIYYSPCLTEELIREHDTNPGCIITEHAIIPAMKDDSTLVPYKDWKVIKHADRSLRYDSLLLCPLGYAGVLYPAGVFDDETTNREVFLSLCPMADDIWFFVMGLRLGVKKVIVHNSKVKYNLTDLFRQINQKDRLHDMNVGEGKNDIQLKALMKHYGIEPDKIKE